MTINHKTRGAVRDDPKQSTSRDVTRLMNSDARIGSHR
jgi:hypothetical protein